MATSTAVGLVQPAVSGLVLRDRGASPWTVEPIRANERDAYAGLQRFLELNSDATSGVAAPGCPLIDADEFEATIVATGNDQPVYGVLVELEDERYAEIDPGLRGIDCTALGGAEGELVPALAVTLSVVAGDDEPGANRVVEGLAGTIIDRIEISGLEGEVRLSCVQDTAACSAWWSSGLLVAGITVEAPEIDSGVMATLAGRLVPSVLTTMAGWAEAVTTDLDLGSEAARAATAVATFVEENPVPAVTPNRLAPCPAVDRGTVVQALGGESVAPLLDDWGYFPLAPMSDVAASTLICAGDDDERTPIPLPILANSVTLSVLAFGNADAASGYATSAGRLISAEPLPEVSGSLLVSSCVGSGDRSRTCDSRWWEGPFVVDLTVTGQPGVVDAAGTDVALLKILPTIVTNLAA